MKLLKTIFVLLVIVIASIAVRNAVVLRNQESRQGSIVVQREDSISGTPSYFEDDIYVTAYATTSIIARNVTSSDMIRLIQNVGDQPVTLWLFADATTTQPTYAGGAMHLRPINATSSDASQIDLSWFRGSIYAVTESSHTYLKVLVYP